MPEPNRCSTAFTSSAAIVSSSKAGQPADGSSIMLRPGREETVMDLRFSPDELAFRDELRAFIRDHLPEDIRERMRLGYAPRKEDTVRWQRILNERGWAAFNWPREYGGPGWTPVERMIFLEENQLAPDITVRPIVSIDGSHHLNEVFFDDVRVPVEMRVGEENRGWDVAKYLLGHERTGIARLGKSKERVKFAKGMAHEMRANGKPLIDDPAFRLRVAQLETDIKALEITQFRVVSAYAKKEAGKPDPLSSALKIKGTELLQATTELAMDVGGPLAMPDWAQELEALSNEPELGPSWASEATKSYLFLRAASIYGGTNEIQKNILTKAVLGLSWISNLPTSSASYATLSTGC